MNRNILFLQFIMVSIINDKNVFAYSTMKFRNLNNNKMTVEKNKENVKNDVNITDYIMKDNVKSTYEETSTQQYFHLHPNHESYFGRKVQFSTPSFIEFHYMDNFDHNMVPENISSLRNYQAKVNAKDSIRPNIAFFHPAYFLFRLHDVTCKAHTTKTLKAKTLFNKGNLRKDNIPPITNNKMKSIFTTKKDSHLKSVPNVRNISNTFAFTYKSTLYYKKTKHPPISFQVNVTTSNVPILTYKDFQLSEPTSTNDRIKFFEIYDSGTYPPSKLPFIYHNRKIYNSENVNDYDREAFNHHKNNFDNKHKDLPTPLNINKLVSTTQSRTGASKYKRNFLTTIPKNQSTANFNNISQIFTYLSQPARWTDFPFVAVYTYEPNQIRCDCASISPYWLVASAMCLYRQQRDPIEEGRSAYVVYCGSSWRHPERIVYVRQIILHPRFKSNDNIRKKRYNVGLIQVENSMLNTCNGWQPVTLMSHQFAADRGQNSATAVGWGLDRYDVTYTSSEIPSHPLMLYEASVHSGSCPGNADYRAKRLSEGSVKDVYCLSLPNYIEEDKDAVHGSLLLEGGKLIALYLQEERRSEGEQSAQYTGLWRLVPWILKVTGETDEPSVKY